MSQLESSQPYSSSIREVGSQEKASGFDSLTPPYKLSDFTDRTSDTSPAFTETLTSLTGGKALEGVVDNLIPIQPEIDKEKFQGFLTNRLPDILAKKTLPTHEEVQFLILLINATALPRTAEAAH